MSIVDDPPEVEVIMPPPELVGKKYKTDVFVGTLVELSMVIDGNHVPTGVKVDESTVVYEMLPVPVVTVKVGRGVDDAAAVKSPLAIDELEAGYIEIDPVSSPLTVSVLKGRDEDTFG